VAKSDVQWGLAWVGVFNDPTSSIKPSKCDTVIQYEGKIKH